MSKPVILTGLRANNDLHIGNYFGALLPLIDMTAKHAGEYQINLFVPDLHSFTTPIDHRQLYAQTLHNLKLFVAGGLPLDRPELHLYRQSYVPAHSELAWILDCFTGFGEMNRMTQFKDKAGKLMGSAVPAGAAPPAPQPDNTQAHAADETRLNRVSVGLFNYPVLMAADMLLYGATYVPVGDDQTQHLEFTRDIAERMNRQFANEFPNGLFTVPRPVAAQHEFFGKDQGLRIRDLADPAKKMSKSDDSGKGVIFLGDPPAAAAKKIMSATTDSLALVPAAPDYQNQPGISNLLQIQALLQGRPLGEVYVQWSGQTKYGELKAAVAASIEQFLNAFQAKLAAVDDQAVHAKLAASEAAMRRQAGQTLLRVQQAVGLRPLDSPRAQDI